MVLARIAQRSAQTTSARAASKWGKFNWEDPFDLGKFTNFRSLRNIFQNLD